MPWLAEVRESGTNRIADCVVADLHKSQQPIHRHRDAAIRGIAGNFFWNPETGEEVMMNDPKFLRCGYDPRGIF